MTRSTCCAQPGSSPTRSSIRDCAHRVRRRRRIGAACASACRARSAARSRVDDDPTSMRLAQRFADARAEAFRARRRSSQNAASAADVHVRHDRHAEGRAAHACATSSRERASDRRRARARRRRPRARVAAALSHQRLRGDACSRRSLTAAASSMPHALLGARASGAMSSATAAPGSTSCRRSSRTC